MWRRVITLIDLAIKTIALGFVPEGRKPSAANAWLLLIFFTPIIGLPLYALMSSSFVSRRRHRIQQEAAAMTRTGAEKHDEHQPLSDEIESILRLNQRLTGFAATTANNEGLWADYELTIERMVEVIDSAQSTVHVEVYIQAWDGTTDQFYRALKRAAARGVKVRLLFDQIGSLKYPGFWELGDRLSEIGVDWHTMLPIAPLRGRFRRPDLRNHRKIIVVDSKVAFVGSLNLIDRSYLMKNHVKAGRQWIDIMAELSGPVVSSLEMVFATDWYSESGEAIIVPPPGRPVSGPKANVVQVVPSGPGYTTEPNLRMFNAILHHAKDHLVVCSPYFIPDEAMMEAITSACYRGVRVDLLVNEQADQFMVNHAQSSYYQQLLEAGVHIWLFPEPYILHTKFVVADPEGDDPLAVFGSSNLDMRSFGLNYEVSVVVAEGNLLSQLAQLGKTYQSVSHELTLAEWNRRSFGRRYVDNVLRLTSALQ